MAQRKRRSWTVILSWSDNEPEGRMTMDRTSGATPQKALDNVLRRRRSYYGNDTDNVLDAIVLRGNLKEQHSELPQPQEAQ